MACPPSARILAWGLDGSLTGGELSPTAAVEHTRCCTGALIGLPAGRQALQVLAHLRCGHTHAQLAAGFGVGTGTVHRYVTEAVDALAALAPDLATAAQGAARKAFVILDETLLSTHRVAADRPYYSGKARSTG